MTERDPSLSSEGQGPAGQTAGQMIKAARQAAGVHIAALAASIKVSVQKLEALEDDRYDELPDPTFARALAKTVCRFLKIDPTPVLARLPEPGTPSRLEHVAVGLNQPFRDGGLRRSDRLDLAWWSRPAVWLPLLILLAALALWLMPAGMLPSLGGGEEASPSSPAPSAPASGPAAPAAPAVPAAPASPASEPAVQQPVLPPLQPASVSGANSGPAAAVAQPAAAPAAPAPQEPAGAGDAGGWLVVRTSGESWVEVRDATGRVLLSKLMRSGETAPVDGPLPLRLLIGNASVTEVSVRGQPLDLKPYVRDNVARVELR